MSNDILFLADAHLAQLNASNVLLPEGEDDKIPDRVRYLTGNFWVLADRRESIGARQGSTHIQNFGYKQFWHQKYPSTPSQPNLIHTSELRGEIGVVENFSLRVSNIRDDQGMNELRHWFEQDVVYTDNCSEFNLYETRSNQSEASLGLANMYCEVSHEYNYYNQSYESKIEDDNIHHDVLPNFYRIITDYFGFSRIRSLDGNIPLPSDSERYTPNNQYFEDWVEIWDRYTTTRFYRNAHEGMDKKIYFTKDNVIQMNELYKYRESFPMYTSIEFTTDPNSLIGDILEDTSFSNQMLSYLSFVSPTVKSMTEVRAGLNNFNQAGTLSYTERKPIRYYDANHIFENYDYDNAEEAIRYFNESDIDGGIENRAYYTLMSMIVQGRIQRLKKDKYRKYSELVRGKVAYTEPVFYRLEKRDNETGDLLQEYFFANTSEVDVIKLVDSQVKYGKKYKYDLISWNVVVGTKYNYIVRNAGVVNNYYSFNFDVESRPNILLTEVHLMGDSVWLMDNPPVNPDVEIIPIVGKNDQIRLHLTSPTGRFSKEPIIFSEFEEEMIQRFRTIQKTNKGNEITYESDDNIRKFIIYRMDFLPTNYMQFDVHGLVREVKTLDEFTTGITGRDTSGTSASLLEEISPNKKYYYCFRSIDVHGNYSYPSEVYQVEIIDDHGSVYPVIKLCEMRPQNTKQRTRSFKRFMYVSPSLKNFVPNEEAMDIQFEEEGSGPEIGQNISLGPSNRTSDETVWGKEFMIRLKSKTTDRIFDFNFSLDYSQRGRSFRDPE